jgi:hypothetical protein
MTKKQTTKTRADSKETIVRKALVRLVENLTEKATMESLEGALAYANIALGTKTEVDRQALMDNIELIAVQNLIDTMAKNEANVFQLSVKNGDSDASIIATTSANIAARLTMACEDRPFFHVHMDEDVPH